MLLSSPFLLTPIWIPWAATSFLFSEYGFSKGVLCFSTGICSRWLSSYCASHYLTALHLLIFQFFLITYLWMLYYFSNIFINLEMQIVWSRACQLIIHSATEDCCSESMSYLVLHFSLIVFCNIPCFLSQGSVPYHFFPYLNPHFVKTTCTQVIYFDYTWHEFILPGYPTVFKIEEKPGESTHKM